MIKKILSMDELERLTITRIHTCGLVTPLAHGIKLGISVLGASVFDADLDGRSIYVQYNDEIDEFVHSPLRKHFDIEHAELVGIRQCAALARAHDKQE